MRAARAARPAPFVDRTRYTCWNGMLAGALIRAGVVLNDPWALEHGLRTLDRIRGEHDDPTRLRHSPDGVGGLLDDQVQVTLAAIEAHEATGNPEWLGWAVALLDRVWEEYLDDDSGGLFDTSATSGEGLLPTRIKPVQDAPTPSPNGVAALAAARLAELTGEAGWTERRDSLLRAFAGSAGQLGLHGATYLQALDWALNPVTHLVVIDGGDSGDTADEMHRMALCTFLPRRVVQRVRASDAKATLPSAVAGMLGAGTGTRGYACIGTRCLAPSTTTATWTETLANVARSPG